MHGTINQWISVRCLCKADRFRWQARRNRFCDCWKIDESRLAHSKSFLFNFTLALVRRQKRKTARRRSKARYLQAFAQCLCDINPITGERKGSCFGAYQGKIAVQLNESVRTFGNLQPSRCLCQLDMVSKTLWPCFPCKNFPIIVPTSRRSLFR